GTKKGVARVTPGAGKLGSIPPGETSTGRTEATATGVPGWESGTFGARNRTVTSAGEKVDTSTGRSNTTLNPSSRRVPSDANVLLYRASPCTVPDASTMLAGSSPPATGMMASAFTWPMSVERIRGPDAMWTVAV